MEPDFEVESGAGVASGVEKAESDAAIDAAAEKNGDSEALVGNTAGEIRLDIRRIKALRRVRDLGHHRGRRRGGHTESSGEEVGQPGAGGVPGLKEGFNKSSALEMDGGDARDRRRRHGPQSQHCFRPDDLLSSLG